MSEHPWISQLRTAGDLKRCSMTDAIDKGLQSPSTLSQLIDFVPVVGTEAFIVSQQQPLSVIRTSNGCELVALTRGLQMRENAFNEEGIWRLPYQPLLLRMLPLSPDPDDPKNGWELAGGAETNETAMFGGGDAKNARAKSSYQEFTSMYAAGFLGAECQFLSNFVEEIRKCEAKAISTVLADSDQIRFRDRVLLGAMEFSWSKNLVISLGSSDDGHLESAAAADVRAIKFDFDNGRKIKFE
jgi:hypothetical protein